LSLIRLSPARDPSQMLSKLVHEYEWAQIAAIDGIGLLILGAIFSLCNNIRKCERATEAVLRQFYEVIREDGTL
jgi:hypothetical protein